MFLKEESIVASVQLPISSVFLGMREMKTLSLSTEFETSASKIEAVPELYIFRASVSEVFVEASDGLKHGREQAEVAAPAAGPRERQSSETFVGIGPPSSAIL